MTDTTHVAVVAQGAVRLYRMNGEGLAEWATVKGEVTPEDAAVLAVQLATFMAGAQLPAAPGKPLALPAGKPTKPARTESARERTLRLDRERKARKRQQRATAESEPLRVRATDTSTPGAKGFPGLAVVAAAVAQHPGLTTGELRALHPDWPSSASVALHNAMIATRPRVRKVDGRWWPVDG